MRAEVLDPCTQSRQLNHKSMWLLILPRNKTGAGHSQQRTTDSQRPHFRSRGFVNKELETKNVLSTIAWIFSRHESRDPRPMHPKQTAEPQIHVAPLSSTNTRQAQDMISSGLPIPNARIFDRGDVNEKLETKNVLSTIAWIFSRHESRGPRPMHPKQTAEPQIHVAPHSSTNTRQAQDIISSGLPIPDARIYLLWVFQMCQQGHRSRMHRQRREVRKGSTARAGESEGSWVDNHQDHFIFVIRTYDIERCLVL